MRTFVVFVLLIFYVDLSLSQNSPATLPLPGCGTYNCPPPPREPSRLSDSDCLAFLRLNDVYLECGGVIHRITATRDVVSFSVGEDNGLALIRQAPGLNESLELIEPPYKRGKILRSHITGHVESTCGAQLLFEVNNGRVSISDLATSKPLTFNNAANVRCADDSSVRLLSRHSDLNGADLYFERNGSERLVSNNVREFAISRMAEYIAFARGSEVCGIKSTEVGRDPICLQQVWSSGRMVVSDNGLVFITEDTSEACPNPWEERSTKARTRLAL